MNSPRTFRMLIRPGLAATLLAVVSAVALYALVRATGDSLHLVSGGKTVTVSAAAVVVVSILGSLGGLVIAWLSARRRWSRRAFLAICGTALAASLIFPFAAAKSVETGMWLAAMHLAVGGSVLFCFGRSAMAARRPVSKPGLHRTNA